jgi:hypothetical protein
MDLEDCEAFSKHVVAVGRRSSSSANMFQTEAQQIKLPMFRKSWKKRTMRRQVQG